MTYKEMCELISNHWKKVHDIIKSPKEIWEYSSTGELFMISLWYEEAINHDSKFIAV
jgi:hypothetical protein